MDGVDCISYYQPFYSYYNFIVINQKSIKAVLILIQPFNHYNGGKKNVSLNVKVINVISLSQVVQQHGTGFVVGTGLRSGRWLVSHVPMSPSCLPITKVSTFNSPEIGCFLPITHRLSNVTILPGHQRASK